MNFSNGFNSNHDTRYLGVVNDRHVFQCNVPLRCERALRILTRAQGEWLPTFAVVAAFKALHDAGYSRSDVRHALNILVSAKIIEQERHGGTLVWRATSRSARRWRALRWEPRGGAHADAAIEAIEEERRVDELLSAAA